MSLYLGSRHSSFQTIPTTRGGTAGKVAWISTLVFLMACLSALGVSASPVVVREALPATKQASPVVVLDVNLRGVRSPDLHRVAGDLVPVVVEELIRAGYDARDAEAEQAPSGLVLGGRVREFDCVEAEGKTCGIAVEWNVLDVATEALVYRVFVRHEESEYATMGRNEGARALLRGAVRSLLSRKKFRDTLESSGARYRKRLEPAELQACEKASLSMPADAERVLNATAVVRARDGVGSAVAVSPDGYYLTAAHVVAGPERTTTTLVLRGGKEHEAAVVRFDPARDVMLLRLKKPTKDVACLTLSAANPKAGEDLYVIGAPAGEEFSFSLSRGILSGKRKIYGQEYFQTDASINPGNSGGPLVDGSAEVVGIVSGKMSATALEGLGFAVPIESAMKALSLTAGAQTSARLAGESAETNELSEPTVDRPDEGWRVVVQDQAPRRRRKARWAGPVLGAGISAMVVGGALVGVGAATVDSRGANTAYAMGGTMIGVGAAATIAAALAPAAPEPQNARLTRLVPLAGLHGGGLQVSFIIP